MNTPWTPALSKRRKDPITKAAKKPLVINGITVGSILRNFQPKLSNAVLMGQCSDGLPFLMELADPEIGAVLIGCEAGCGKTHQLQVMVDSALETNTPHELQVFILTKNTAEWDRLEQHPRYQKFIQGIHAWYDPRAEEMIRTLTELAEARRESSTHHPAVLFILDDLNCVEDLSIEAQVNLHWLLAYGAQSDVWIISTINAGLVAANRYWVDVCRTRVLGKVVSSDVAETLSMRSDAQVSGMEPGEFKVWIGTHWLSYRLPLLGG